MKRSTSAEKLLCAVLIPVFWLLVWWGIARLVDREVLVPSPDRVLLRLLELIRTTDFLAVVGFSILRITAGFFAGVILGTLTGVLNARLPLTERMLAPLLAAVKATPVASFIILALVWMKKDAIPVFISFLMVFPVVQSNVAEGIRRTPKALLEMAQVYRLPPLRTLLAIRLPAVLPYFAAACRTSFGLAWKAGVAAEVISLPARSIGRELYLSKLYLETVDVFAWTAAVILISMVAEKLLGAALRRFVKGGEPA